MVFLALGGLQGCSFFSFKDCNILTLYDCSFKNNNDIIDTGSFSYSYQEPARKPLSKSRIKSLKLHTPRAKNQYYSANGHICRTIDATGSEVVCSVSGQWQTSPSILANSLPQ